MKNAVATGVVGVLCVVCLGAPDPARADTDLSAYARAQYEVDSNLFAVSESSALVPPGVQATSGNEDDRQLGDTILSYRGGFTSRYNIAEQSLFLTAQATRFQYQDFSNFDHTEYNGQGGLTWRLGTAFDGVLQYSRSRALALAIDRLLTPDSIDTSSVGTFGLNWQMTGLLRVESTADVSEVDSPRAQAPDFRQNETYYHLALTRNTGRRISVGLSGDWRDGKYEDTGPLVAAPYTYLNTAGTLTWKIGERTQLNGNVGRGRYKVEDNPAALTATTGSVYLSHQLGKTSLSLGMNRSINSYVSSGGAEVDTGWTASVDWRPTGKSTIRATLARSSLDLSLAQLQNTLYQRSDTLSVGTLEWILLSRTWLQFRLYDNYQKRASSLDGFSFDGNSFGISVQLNLGSTTPAAR